MSVSRHARRGTTGDDAGLTRGRRAQSVSADRGRAADTSALGVPTPGQAREMRANPGPGAVSLGGQQRAAATAMAAAGTTVPTRATAPAGTTAAPGRQQHAPATGAPATGAPAAGAPSDRDLFARYTRDYVTAREGQQVTILQAGCTTADGDLGVGALRAAGADVVVSLIDDDQPDTSAAVGMHQSLAGCVQGDLRAVPLPPRCHDIVLCALLLQRIKHTELVLDRLVAAIRPGGLLLLRFRDRDSAGGFLDRVLPTVARRAVWRKRRPGQPGPYPAVYERLSSARGVQAYAQLRGLVIAERGALGGLAGAMAETHGFLAAQKLIAWLSHGRLTDEHEDLLYVLRKPEDLFARVL